MTVVLRAVGRALLVAASVASAAGCQPAVFVPTWSPGPNSGMPGALAEGILIFEDRCFWLSHSGLSRDRMALLWPPGFTGTLDPPRVLDASGAVVARAGDRLSIGGGSVGPQSTPCGWQAVFMVGEIEQAPFR